MSDPHNTAGPSCKFASDDHLMRYVVVIDPTANVNGWSIHYHHVDGESGVSAFV